MHERTRSVALPVPTVGPAVWMTLLLFLLATTMMGCEAPEDFEDIELEAPGEPEEEDYDDNGEEEDSASLPYSGAVVQRA